MSAPVAGSVPAGTSKRRDRVAELGLIRDPDRLRRIQAGDGTQPDIGQPAERDDRLAESRLGVSEIRAEADVGAHGSGGHGPLVGCG